MGMGRKIAAAGMLIILGATGQVVGKPSKRPDTRVLVACAPSTELSSMLTAFNKATVNHRLKSRRGNGHKERTRESAWQFAVPAWGDYVSETDGTRYSICAIRLSSLESAYGKFKPKDAKAIEEAVDNPAFRLQLTNHLPNLLKQWRLRRAKREPGTSAPTFEF